MEIFSEFYFKIYGYYNRYKKESEKNVFSNYLLGCVKNSLTKYNEKEWEEIQEYFAIDKDSFYTTEEILVLFVIYSSYKKKMIEIDNHIIYALVISLIKAQINPYNFEKYIDMIINPSIYQEILKIDAFELTKIIFTLFRFISFEEIYNKDYREALKVLCNFNNSIYSPIFNGNFNLINVYSCLIDIVSNQKSGLYLKKSEIDALDNLLELDKLLNDDMRSDFQMRISQKETEYSNKRIELVRQIGTLAKNYKASIKLEMVLIRQQKNE